MEKICKKRFIQGVHYEYNVFVSQYKKVIDIRKARKHTLLVLNFLRPNSKYFLSGWELHYKVYKGKLYELHYHLPPPLHFNCNCKIEDFDNE